jgi:hypothetical protein
MPLPTKVTLAYTAYASGGLSPTKLATMMQAVKLYAAPPADAPAGTPAGTADAVLDVLYGANVQSIGGVLQDSTTAVGSQVTRTIVLTLRFGATGDYTAPSFVSLGNSDPSKTATTNNPPYPAAVTPSVAHPAPPDSLWIGCVVSSSPKDDPVLTIHYTDYEGTALTENVVLTGQTPVNLTASKYAITHVEIIASPTNFTPPAGQVNFWSGPVDDVTGFPTGIVVGYLPCSYFTNFSFKQLTGWTDAQVADASLAYSLVPPDYNTPNQTVITPVGTPPPPPSKALLNYPPPSSVASPNPGSTPDALLTPQPNFTIENGYLSEVAGTTIVPNPFQGFGLGAFAQALSIPASRTQQTGTVSMTVTFS